MCFLPDMQWRVDEYIRTLLLRKSHLKTCGAGSFQLLNTKEDFPGEKVLMNGTKVYPSAKKVQRLKGLVF